MNYVVECKNLEETNDFAAKFAGNIRGGEIIQLVGDMGAGKTTFTKALVAKLGSTDNVSSPTFTICNRYNAKFVVNHCDFYRLADDKLIEQEIKDLMNDKEVLIIEWGENLKSMNDIDHIEMRIDLLSETARNFTVVADDKYNYLKVL